MKQAPPFHKVGLYKMSITIQNLVKVSFTKLLLQTPFKPRQLIDWMTRGRLCLQFKSDSKKLQDSGVRTILGFKIIGDLDTLDELAGITNLDHNRLKIVSQIIKDGPAIERLTKTRDCLHMI